MRGPLGRIATGLVALVAAGLALRASWPGTRVALVEPPVPTPREWIAPDTRGPGESLGTLFARHGVGGVDLPRSVELLAIDPRRMPAGLVVIQGHVVGHVGSSGLATSAHVHYEFRQNGAARDPSRIDLGNGEPIPAAEVAAFRDERDRFRGLLSPPKPSSPTIAADPE